jgi:hypothetical protein
VVGEVEVEPAEDAVMIAVAGNDHLRAVGREVQAPDEARTCADAGARFGGYEPFARVPLPRQKTSENRA